MRQLTVTVTREDHLWVAIASGLSRGVVGAMDCEHFLELREEFPLYLGELLEVAPEPLAISWVYQVNGSLFVSRSGGAARL
jgi:hypothetical protein